MRRYYDGCQSMTMNDDVGIGDAMTTDDRSMTVYESLYLLLSNGSTY